jgi:vesicle transport protein SEC22
MLVTILCRVSDGMPLVESADDEKDHRSLDELKKNAKAVCKRLNSQSPPKCSVEAAEHCFYYVIRQGVCYLTICLKSYPKRLAFA